MTKIKIRIMKHHMLKRKLDLEKNIRHTTVLTIHSGFSGVSLFSAFSVYLIKHIKSILDGNT